MSYHETALLRRVDGRLRECQARLDARQADIDDLKAKQNELEYIQRMVVESTTKAVDSYVPPGECASLCDKVRWLGQQHDRLLELLMELVPCMLVSSQQYREGYSVWSDFLQEEILHPYKMLTETKNGIIVEKPRSQA